MPVELAQQFTQQLKTSEGGAGNLTPEKLSSNVLLHELELGDKLNTSVAETRRADFSLMLAMLVEDVREQSQFLLPKTPAHSDVEYSDSSLRKEFHLPKKAPLALSTLDEIKQFNQAQIIVDNGLASIQLSNALSPKPLAFRDNKKHIHSEVIQNTSLFTQLKYKQEPVTQALNLQETQQVTVSDLDKPLNKPSKFNANAWLDGIQESLVKAPLLN